MASAQAFEIPEEQKIITDFWEIRKQFYYPEDNNEYWDELINAVDNLADKYKSTYLNELLLVCVYDIEQRFNHSNQTGTVIAPGKQLENTYNRLKKRYKEELE